MKFLISITICICALFHAPAFGMEALLQKQKKMADDLSALAWLKTGEGTITTHLVAQGPRPLIILFDPSENEKRKNYGALVITLRTALNEKAAPIITSYVLYNWIKKEQAVKDWIIYETLDEALVILIPNTPFYRQYRYTSNADLLLGIKISALGMPGFFTKQSKPMHDKYDLRSYLNDILITHKYLKENVKGCENCFVTWDIYLSGHGDLAKRDYQGKIIKEGMIADIPITNFKELMHFLNTGISTRSLAYDTCYAGGEHLEMPYQFASLTVKEEEVEKQLKQNLKNQEDEAGLQEINPKFMIISSTIFEKPTTSEVKSGSLAATIQFKNYFNELNKYFKNPENTPLSKVIDFITEWSKSYDPEEGAWLQLPTVRFPNTGWFVIPEMDETVFILDSGAIKRAQKTGKITVKSTVKLILVNTEYIPIKLVLEGDSMPLFIPYKFQRTKYYFQEIYAPNIYLIAGENTSGTPDNPKIDLVTMLSMLDKKISALKDGQREGATFNIGKLTINLDDNHKLSDFDQKHHPYPFTRGTICTKPDTIKGPLIFNNIWLTTSGIIVIPPITNPQFDLFVSSTYEYEKEITSASKEQTIFAEEARLEGLFNEYLTLQDKPLLLQQWKEKLSKKDQDWINGISAPTEKDFEDWESKNWTYVEGGETFFKATKDFLDRLRRKGNKKHREQLVREYLKLKDKPKFLDAWQKELSQDDKKWLNTLTNSDDAEFQAFKFGKPYEETQWLDQLRSSVRPQIKSGEA